MKKGDTILVHAAAGGVGLILCQWAKHLGATVIGTVGSDEKAEIAGPWLRPSDRLPREDFVKRVDELTDGKKLPVVYDGVGKDTFMKSLDCLAPFGLLVLFGNASGPVDNFNTRHPRRERLALSHAPDAQHLWRQARDHGAMAKELFDVVLTGAVKIEVNQTYPLQRGGARPSRPREPQDHGLHGADGVEGGRAVSCQPSAIRYASKTAPPPGLFPGIHAWMAGTSPAMTIFTR